MFNYIVTGGAGFIGSHLVEHLVSNNAKVVVLDKFTYASQQTPDILNNKNVLTVRVDIASRADLYASAELIQDFFSKGTFSIFHLAAESHVDRSIESADSFVLSNVLGTQVMLDFARDFVANRFLHVSTDEVYGSLKEGLANEDSPLNPSSAYSATKTGSDLLVLAHNTTFGTPTIITRCVNNFGPRQSLEKFIPRALSKIFQSEPVPVYGNGMNIREWIYVKDHCKLLYELMQEGAIGEIYNLGSGIRISNLEIIETLQKLTGKNVEKRFIMDRKGHDFRYALNSEKVHELLPKFKPQEFEESLAKTINYYVKYSESREFKTEYRLTEDFYAN
jgi:dTDP-glucose 4,6-dehydratase